MAGYIGSKAVSVNTTSATISDDLTVGDDATIAGTALVTGVLTTTAATVHTNGITMPDSAKAIFGAGSDGSIYSDGSNLKVNTNAFYLNTKDNSEAIIAGVNGGAVTLYHNNAAKLASTATGIDVTGTAIVDRIQSANDSSDPWLKGTNSGGTETSYIKKDGTGYFGGGVAIGGTGTANTLEDYEEGAVSLALTGANGNPSTAVAITGTYVKIGRSVNVRVLSTSFNNTGAAGPIALTGFPFASAGAYGIGSIGETNDMMTFTNSPFIVVSGDAGYIYQNISEANSVAVNHHVDAACSFIMNVTYETNS